MSGNAIPGGEEPPFYIGETPVRLISLLVGLQAAALVVVSLLSATGHGEAVTLLSYDSTAVAHGQVWRLATYPLVSSPSVWFLFEMLMLYYFGREVENGLGWRRFGILYAGLILLGPVLLQAFASSGRPQSLAGAGEIGFAVFAAFAAMHPGAQFFFGLAARWVFLGLLGVTSLQLLSDHLTARFAVLLVSCLMSVFLIRKSGFNEPLLGYGFRWPFSGGVSLPTRRPSFSVVNGGASSGRRASVSPTTEVVPDAGPHPEEVLDMLLEKIGRQGLSSLSAEERSSLEKARKMILLRGGDSAR